MCIIARIFRERNINPAHHKWSCLTKICANSIIISKRLHSAMHGLADLVIVLREVAEGFMVNTGIGIYIYIKAFEYQDSAHKSTHHEDTGKRFLLHLYVCIRACRSIDQNIDVDRCKTFERQYTMKYTIQIQYVIDAMCIHMLRATM